MEQRLPIIAKKFWSVVRVLYFMLRKGISKGKLFADLNTMMKRGKIAGKAAIHNLIHYSSTASRHVSRHPDCHLSYPVPLDEYEFSCSNTPAHPTTLSRLMIPFHLINNKRKNSHQFSTSQSANNKTSLPPFDSSMLAAALEIFHSATNSPALPGFGPSPMVRKLRITDSPFPLGDIEEDNHVDEHAEEFIMKFYKNLKQQNASLASLGYS